MKDNKSGPAGEKLAAAYLREQGYAIAARNYRTRFGEIDIIASNSEYLAFVEVKTRKNDSFAQAREYVDAGKQRRVFASAGIWLSEHPTELQPRFDVAEVYLDPANGEKGRIAYYPDAFQID